MREFSLSLFLLSGGLGVDPDMSVFFFGVVLYWSLFRETHALFYMAFVYRIDVVGVWRSLAVQP